MWHAVKSKWFAKSPFWKIQLPNFLKKWMDFDLSNLYEWLPVPLSELSPYCSTSLHWFNLFPIYLSSWILREIWGMLTCIFKQIHYGYGFMFDGHHSEVSSSSRVFTSHHCGARLYFIAQSSCASKPAGMEIWNVYMIYEMYEICEIYEIYGKWNRNRNMEIWK